MNPTAAAQSLVDARRSGRRIAALPTAPPQSLDEALLVQGEVVRQLGEAVGGWKCSVPKGERTIVAPIFASTIHRTPPVPAVAASGLTEIEPEIAYVLGQDLRARPAPYSEAEVRGAVAECRMVLELMGSRYIDLSAVTVWEKLADGYNNQGLFVGPCVQDSPDLARFDISIAGAGFSLARKGAHQDGHPIRPLCWLANFLSARGGGLAAGQIVTTGSYAGILEVPIGLPLRVQYLTRRGPIGTMDVSFV